MIQEKETLEAECLANADALVHLEQVPSLLYYAFVQREMEIDERTEFLNKMDEDEKVTRWQKHLECLTNALARQGL